MKFERTLIIVENYWEVGPDFVYLSFASVSHSHLKKCRDRAVQYVICAGMHKFEDHRCGVTDSNVEIDKIYTYVTNKCANCGAQHQATTLRY